MTNRGERLSVDDARPAVATYSRLPASHKRRRVPRGGEAAGPVLSAAGGPVLDAAEVPFVDRREREAALIGDFLGERRWPLSLKLALVVGAVATLAGTGVLMSAYDSALTVGAEPPLAVAAAVETPALADGSASAAVASVAAPAGVPAASTAQAPAAQLALGENAAAPVFAPPVVTEIPPIQPSSAASTAASGPSTFAPPPEPSTDEAAAPAAAPPTPHPRPPGETGEGPPRSPPPQSAGNDMDRLMNEIDQILASLPPAGPPVDLLPPAAGAPAATPGVARWPGLLAPPSDGAQPSGVPPSPTPTAESSSPGPVEQLGQSVFEDAPVPPEPIPDEGLLSILR